MIVKTFSGPSLRDALAEVRQAFGDDAVILDTRFEAQTGDRLGNRERNVHVTAAFEPNPTDQKVVEGPRSLTLKGNLGDDVELPSTELITDDSDEPHEKEAVELPKTTNATVAEVPAAPPAIAVEAAAPVSELLERMAEIAAAAGGHSGQAGLTTWLSTQAKLSADVVEAYAAHIAESLPPFGPFLEREKTPLRMLFVGGRGAGRSNAMLKACATRWRQRQSQPNLLVVGHSSAPCHDNLESVCRSCGLSLNTESLSKGKFSLDRDLKKADLFAEFVPDQTHADLSDQARAIRKSLSPDVVVLVINATSAPEHWVRVIKRFAAFEPTHLIVTHWDEHQPWSEVAALAKDYRLSLAYRVSGSDLFDEIDPFTESDIRSGVGDSVAGNLSTLNSSKKRGGSR